MVDEVGVADQHIHPTAGARLREELLQIAVTALHGNAGLPRELGAQRLDRALVARAGQDEQGRRVGGGGARRRQGGGQCRQNEMTS